ncbi:DUF2637 domain-containing protein [Streptomyces sp. NPDC059534]|uniref:DUF2637 domain-containing protein n=1 Tax=Streptomyces sp. NPDC059534 TaxID=3346859 RepID=UPI00367F50A8
MQDLKTITPATAEHATVPAPAVPVQTSAASAPLAPTLVPPEAKTIPSTSAAAPRPWSVKAMQWVTRLSLAAAAVVAGIGFTGSYDALEGLAREHGFGWFSWIFPVGIDAGIVALYGVDLVLVHRRMPKPLLRMIAHVLTVATIVFSAASGEQPIAEDPLGAFMHGVLPLLFVAVVDGARHLIIRTNRLVLGAESEGVPLHRWILSPAKTWGLYRRMRLWGIASYAQMVAMEQERVVYRAWLQHQYGRGWKKKAGAAALLPFILAAYGLSVDEALDQPRKQQEDADRRAQAEALAAAQTAREAAARAEAAALQAEDTARLSPVERAVRKVARMILTAHHALPADQRPATPDMYAVPLKDIENELNISHTVAGQRRQAAAELIATGYTG